MPARRPYASRGVPRRATTRRTGRSVRAPGIVSLAIGVGLILAFVAWVAKPFDASTQQNESAAGFRAVAGQVLVAAAGTNAGPAGGAPGLATADQTTAATTRRWDSAAPGIVVDPILASRLDQALLG